MQTVISAKDQYALKNEKHLVLHGVLPTKDIEMIATAMEANSDDRWHHSRDLFRQSKDVLKVLSRPSFVSVISQLINHHTYRLIFDQMLYAIDDDVILPKLYHQSEPFESQFCYQGILLGAIICIEPGEEEALPFLTEEGAALFFTHDFSLTFEPLLSMKKGKYLLVAFGRDPIIFRENSNDPFQNQMRRLGMSYGDKVSKLHPQFF